MEVLKNTVEQEISPQAMLFMKVGFHVSENFDQIVLRKKLEESRCGVVFWGYNGVICHPTRQVIPFAQSAAHSDISVIVVLSVTNSIWEGEEVQAQELSNDGKSWKPIPEGALVKDSQYALVCKGLEKADAFVDLSQYQIGIGPSKGTQLSKYLRYRVAKACAKRVEQESLSYMRVRAQVAYTATLVPPYAVYIR